MTKLRPILPRALRIGDLRKRHPVLTIRTPRTPPPPLPQRHRLDERRIGPRGPGRVTRVPVQPRLKLRDPRHQHDDLPTRHEVFSRDLVIRRLRPSGQVNHDPNRLAGSQTAEPESRPIELLAKLRQNLDHSSLGSTMPDSTRGTGSRAGRSRRSTVRATPCGRPGRIPAARRSIASSSRRACRR
jgi:hypothetical protein